jgi:1-deoxy-D-xylulose-5-phosphate reductoisomerase
MERRGIALLGATGSIGRSALAVIDQHPDAFRPVVLTANRRADALAELVSRYRPEVAVIADPPSGWRPPPGPTRWLCGREAVLEAAAHPGADVVLNALVGAAGLEPTLAALAAGKRVALANKESLVCAGDLVMAAAREGAGVLVPVDSEHSAILQCLAGAQHAEVARLVITASGGPFREHSPERLAAVSPGDALRHPTWDMGAKITIDSATLANKALEVIEAHFLFDIGYDAIDAVVHPQSIIHSMVEFRDGSVLAQMGFPTMEVPILYALSHPRRVPYETRRFDPVAAGTLTFEEMRRDLFPTFGLGVEAGRRGGTAPAVFNAANEVAVAAFLAGELDFPGIPAVIEGALTAAGDVPADSLEAVLEADADARRLTRTLIERRPTP